MKKQKLKKTQVHGYLKIKVTKKNKEKLKHIGTNSRGVQKKQIIKKTKKMHQRKLINTREELEMMKNGLLEMFNLPINDHAEMMNVMECRRTMKEILGGINNQPANKNFSKPIFKWKIPKVERPHNKTMYDLSLIHI